MSANKQTSNRSYQKPPSNFQRLARRFMSGLLRSLFFASKPTTSSKAGFVLPTTVLLLLMVSLTVGAMSYRTFSRTSQTIAYRNQQVIDGLAAPAIDRAKAKIEFLFTKDPLVADKRPPSSTDLLDALEKGKDNIYRIPDEKYEDLDGDSTTYDNAWSFPSPDNTTIIYSITLDDSNNGIDINSNVDDAERAANSVIRNGPIDTTAPKDKCPVERLAGDGWQLSGARLAKNIQVDVLSVKGTGPSKTVSAAEYQQVRTASRGTRWGAWFRYDMEITPGAAFRWNGAMHTEGSLIASGAKKEKGKLIAYMVSSANSCVYDDDASVIEVSGWVDNDEDGKDDFRGELVSGGVGESGNSSFIDDRAVFHTDATATKPNTKSANDPYPEGVSKLSAKDSGKSRDTIIQKNGGSAADVMQDPIRIFTEDKFIHVSDPEDLASKRKWERDPDGGTPRVTYDTAGAARPFLDDSFRADDRYGPKPTYNSTNGLGEVNGVKLATSHRSGDDITDNDLLIEDSPETQNYGLDGYWERSAASQGLRLVVGQRLELGNAFGWGENNDPLYPAKSLEEMKTDDSNKLKGKAERLQMRSLRDNLAAVQSMAIYHSLDAVGGKYPLACFASTVHPGTQATLENSRTFEKYSYDSSKLKTDFLTGNGTNGVEFTPPAKSKLGVTTTIKDGVSVDQMTTGAIATNASDWFNALNNLAFFAGDPLGGAPSFPASQAKAGASIVAHPYPYMSMWGDFSNLRRIFKDYSSTKPLSIADQSTIHTAACTLGMLARNISSVEESTNYILANSSIKWDNLGNKIANVVKNKSLSQGIPGRPNPSNTEYYKSKGLCKKLQPTAPDYTNPNWTGCPSKNPAEVTGSTDPESFLNYYARFTIDDWLGLLVGSSEITQAESLEIRVIAENTQIIRDRTLGFSKGAFTGNISGNFDAGSGIWSNPVSNSLPKDQKDDKVASLGNDSTSFKMGCDPRIFSTGLASSNSAKSRFGIALIACGSDLKPKYPSLYYLFPRVNHSQIGTDDSKNTFSVNHTQPTTTEDFFFQGSGYSGSYIASVNSLVSGVSKIYKEVDISAIALEPHAPSESAWRTPVRKIAANKSNFGSFSGPETAPTDAFNDSAVNDPGNTEKNLSQNIIRIRNGSNYDFYQTAFLDKAIMDGRELLSIRLMDLDIDLLTNMKAGTSLTDGDTKVGGKAWIREDSGIVYAFREDAVREDSIVRPYSSSLDSNPAKAWDSCKTVKALTTEAGCYMNIDPPTAHDPPLNSVTGISPKPVDMYADPLRRPHGFRLSNGKSLNRPDVTGSVISAGMTFVSDNPVYIRGDFNLHAEKDAADLELALIEEFKGSDNLLGTEFANYGPSDDDEKKARKLFYGRNNLDERFARPNEDNWRPVEIFADSTTMLSNIFLDGWVEDYFVTVSPEPKEENRGKPTKNSSYLNANRPFFTSGSDYDPDKWERESSVDSSSPIRVDRNAKVKRKNASGVFGEFPNVSGGRSISFYQKTSDKKGRLLYLARNTQQPSPELTTGSTPKAPVRINALLIGGIVPAREGQSYGGLHNFPRLLEFWPGRQLVISGGFFQLNFSSQAVAPYDQDAWEPGDPVYSGSQEEIGNTGNQRASQFYYGAAERIWGYDVAFQYTPAGPISRRFVRLDRPRSEFYRELPVDDPYIDLLCKKVDVGSC